MLHNHDVDDVHHDHDHDGDDHHDHDHDQKTSIRRLSSGFNASQSLALQLTNMKPYFQLLHHTSGGNV